MSSRSLRLVLLAWVAGVLMASPAHAVIMVLIPLRDVVDKEEHIFIAKVKEILPDKPAIVLVPDENLKGQAPFDRMPVGLSGDAEARKGKHAAILLDRLDKDTPIVVIATKRGGKYIAFGFTNGTWFQMDGRIEKQEDKEIVRWGLLHAEPYLRRTFSGTTAELKQIILDAVAKKKAPPEPNEKEQPGYGPPIKKDSSLTPDRRSPSFFPVFGVIQLPFLGLIAALAAIFPTVFGGLALFMKRWVAVLSTSGLVSLFVTLPLLVPGWCNGQAIYSSAGIWLSCASIFTLGALWSLRRYRRSLEIGAADVMQPRKIDRRIVTLLSMAGIIAVTIGLAVDLPVWRNEYWRWALAATFAFTAGSWYLVSLYLSGRTESAPVRIAPESVMLWVLAGSCVAFGSWEAGRYSNQGQALVQGGGVGQPSLNKEVLWKFAPQGGGVVVSSTSTPERLYVAVMIVEGLTGRFGRVFALDPVTGAELWHFDNDYEKDSEKGMKPAFSAPIFHDGRLYFGEGLHTDNDSRLFCLDAASGVKKWEYKTESHTESTPFVADGKVVIGAGYHGIHCLDAVNGPGPNNQPLWRYPPNALAADKALHVDCNPIVANGRVYAGSGYKPEYVKDQGKINTIFCLDLNTGNEIWKERTDDSVYGSPLYHDGKVFFGTGNSTYSETFASKMPGVLCRDADTGKEVWYCRLPENVLGRPAADAFQLFVGCLDGKAYALDLRSGQINWKLDMAGPVLASPVVQREKSGIAEVVYFASKTGTINAVAPYSGNVFWSAPLSYWTRKSVEDLSATPSILRTEDDDSIRRRLFIGFGEGRSGSTVPRLYCIEDISRKQ